VAVWPPNVTEAEKYVANKTKIGRDGTVVTIKLEKEVIECLSFAWSSVPPNNRKGPQWSSTSVYRFSTVGAIAVVYSVDHSFHLSLSISVTKAVDELS